MQLFPLPGRSDGVRSVGKCFLSIPGRVLPDALRSPCTCPASVMHLLCQHPLERWESGSFFEADLPLARLLGGTEFKPLPS